VSDVAIIAVQTRYWITTTLRTPRAVIFSLLFPIILLVLFNSIFAGGSDQTTTLTTGERVDASAYFTAGLLAYAITLSAYTSMLVSLVTQREAGELKRYRGTPVPSWTFIVSLALRAVVLVGVMSVIMIALAHFAYDVPLPAGSIGGIAVYVVLGTATMCAIGIGVSSVVDSVDAASSIGPFSAVMLSFISGVFIPIDQLPGWLEAIGKIFPLYHLADGLQRALAIGGGSGLNGSDVGVLAAWGVAGLILAARRFQWEPQVARG
jgi:ABC-2 type transport system permease protein